MTEEAVDAPQPRFEIQKVFVKDASLECPNSPEIFRDHPWKPEPELRVGTHATQLTEHHYEVVVTVTLTVKSGEQTGYLVEVQQGGIFTLANIPEPQMEPLLGIGCPNVLFPFAREAVADLVQKAGFPQHLLPPVNFEHIYAQQSENESAAKQEATEASKPH